MVKHLKILFLLFGVLILSGCKFDADSEYKVIHMLNKASESQMTLSEATEFVEKFIPEIVEHTYNQPSIEEKDIEKLMVFTEKEIEQAYIASEVLSGEMLEYERKNQGIPKELKLNYSILKEQIRLDGKHFLLVKIASTNEPPDYMDSLLTDYFEIHKTGTDGLEFKYKSYYKGLTIVKYTGSSKDIVIPDDIKGIPVTAIEDESYPDYIGIFESKGIQSLNLGKNITYIGESAFESNQITEIDLGNNVEYIDTNAFRDNKIESVYFGENVTNIGNWAFEKNQLKTVTFSPKIEVLDIASNTFRYNLITEVVLPKDVVFVRNWSDGPSTNPYEAFDDTVKYSYHE